MPSAYAQARAYTCYARDSRGRTFAAAGFSPAVAQRSAVSQCNRAGGLLPTVCRPLGCRGSLAYSAGGGVWMVGSHVKGGWLRFRAQERDAFSQVPTANFEKSGSTAGAGANVTAGLKFYIDEPAPPPRLEPM